MAEPEAIAVRVLAARGADAARARTALRLGHDYVGTEHLLLALLEVEGDAGPLASLGVTRAATETAVAEALAAAARGAGA